MPRLLMAPIADVGTYYCDMNTDGGGWTLVGETVAVLGTSYDSTYYNSGFTWNETYTPTFWHSARHCSQLTDWLQQSRLSVCQ